MHTVWKGSISFGLVNVPIKMHAATETQEFHFNYLHEECHNRIRYIKKCPHCDKEVAPQEIVKGYEYEKDQFVIMDEEDLASLEKPMSRSIDILDFIDLKEIDPIYYQKSYYLNPEETAQKAYQLLCKAMADTGKVAIAKITMRSKQHLACLRVINENTLVLETMYYPAEIRQLNVTWEDATPTDTEIAMARQLIENLAAPFEPEKYRDELKEQMKEFIENKVTGETFNAKAVPEPGKVIDLMEALRASIAVTDQEKEKPTAESEDIQNADNLEKASHLDKSASEISKVDDKNENKSTLTPRRRRAKRKAEGA